MQSLPGNIALTQGCGTRLMQYAAEAVAFAAIVIRAHPGRGPRCWSHSGEFDHYFVRQHIMALW